MYRIKFKYVLSTNRYLMLVWTLPVFLILLGKQNIQFDIVFYTLAIFSLPTLLIFLQYLVLSFNVTIEVDNLGKKIIFNKERVYSFENIEEIDLVCSFPHGERRRKVMLTDYFYFYTIKFRNGKRIIITSLMCKEFYISHKQIRIRKKIIPFYDIF